MALECIAKSIKDPNRLMVDHTYDKVFLKKIKVINSNLCDTCNVPEYAEHLTFTCQKLTNICTKFKIFDCYNNLTQLIEKKTTTPSNRVDHIY